jgi:putative transposase
MRQAGIQGAKRRGRPWRTTTPGPSALRRPDLVQRDFSAAGPDRLWVGDCTYLRSWEGVSNSAFVIDACLREIGLSISRPVRAGTVRVPSLLRSHLLPPDGRPSGGLSVSLLVRMSILVDGGLDVGVAQLLLDEVDRLPGT